MEFPGNGERASTRVASTFVQCHTLFVLSSTGHIFSHLDVVRIASYNQDVHVFTTKITNRGFQNLQFLHLAGKGPMKIELFTISKEARVSEIDLSSLSVTPWEGVRNLRTFCLFLQYALAPSDSQKLAQWENGVPEI